MFWAKIPRHTRQNAITEGDLECILTRNCEGTEQLRINRKNKVKKALSDRKQEINECSLNKDFDTNDHTKGT